MPTRTIRAVELEVGQEVLADGDPLGFIVHGVRQEQGRVQVTDACGGSYTFTPDEQVEIRS